MEYHQTESTHPALSGMEKPLVFLNNNAPSMPYYPHRVGDTVSELSRPDLAIPQGAVESQVQQNPDTRHQSYSREEDCSVVDIDAYHNRLKRLNSPTFRKVALQAQQGDKEATWTFCSQLQPIVESLASSRAHPILSVGEYTQEGMLAALQAITRYDLRKGNKLGPFLIRRVKGAFIDAERAHLASYGLHRNAYSKILEAQAAEDAIETQQVLIGGASITPIHEDIACKFGRRPIQESLGTDDPLFTLAAQDETKREVNKAQDLLTLQERAVLNVYYGVDDGEPMNLKDAGELLGFSESRASQIKSKGIGKIQAALVGQTSLSNICDLNLLDEDRPEALITESAPITPATPLMSPIDAFYKLDTEVKVTFFSQLDSFEYALLRNIYLGYEDIAANMDIHEQDIERHLKAIMAKGQVKNINELLLLIVECDLLPDDLPIQTVRPRDLTGLERTVLVAQFNQPFDISLGAELIGKNSNQNFFDDLNKKMGTTNQRQLILAALKNGILSRADLTNA